MSLLISLLIAVIIIGLVLYVISLLPIDQKFKTIANIIVAVIVIIWLLYQFVPFGNIGYVHRY